MKTHRHICGVRGALNWHGDDPPKEEKGCGFVWDHVRSQTQDSQEYRRLHLCPNCGAGPWRTVADAPKELLRAASPYPPRVAFGRILRPNQLDNPALTPGVLQQARDQMLGGADDMLERFEDPDEWILIVGDHFVAGYRR